MLSIRCSMRSAICHSSANCFSSSGDSVLAMRQRVV